MTATSLPDPPLQFLIPTPLSLDVTPETAQWKQTRARQVDYTKVLPTLGISRKAAWPGPVDSRQAAKLHARLDLSTIPSCNGFAFSQVLPFGIAAWQWIERMP
jgi:hypothetical protein